MCCTYIFPKDESDLIPTPAKISSFSIHLPASSERGTLDSASHVMTAKSAESYRELPVIRSATITAAKSTHSAIGKSDHARNVEWSETTSSTVQRGSPTGLLLLATR